MNRITVLLVEDHRVVREGLRVLLEAEPDIEVLGEAQTGRQAMELTRKFHPAVVVIDISMPLLNGLEATRQIRKTFPDTKVVILSALSDDEYVDRAITVGAAAFLVKQTSSHDLSRAIREVHEGNTFFSPSVAKRLHDQKVSARAGAFRKKVARLSSREREVLQLITEGKTNIETAVELGISIKTVEKHRQNLMAKLNIHEISGLTRYAIGAGIIESSFRFTIR
jgi:two-component system, NarL family, nitrate/nitrite response regulator NarL